MAVRRRGKKKVWYYDFQIGKNRYRGRIPEAQNRTEALDAEADVRRIVYRGAYGKQMGSDLFTEYCEKIYLPWARENKRSSKDDETNVRLCQLWFIGRRFADITPMLIEKYKKERRETPTIHGRRRANASVNRELAYLSKVFNLAIRDGITMSNPCRGVKRLAEENMRTRYLTIEEEERLLDACVGDRSHLRPIIVLAVNTGLRRGELFSLRWLHIDFSRQVLHVLRSKSNKARSVPLNRRSLATLRELSNGQPSSGPEDRVFGVTDVKRSFGTACTLAGITNLHFHDLRHTFGTRLGDSGVDINTIASLMGHSDIRMAARYTHPTDKNRKGAVESLTAYSSRAPFIHLSERAASQ